MGKRKETEAQAAARIRRGNDRFAKMTKAEKRVAIAKDVIKWLRLGAMTARRMTYFEPSRNPIDSYRTDIQARDLDFGPCTVCALGAVMVAKAARFDDVTADMLMSQEPSDWRSNLSPYFKESQLRDMEAAFECWDEPPAATAVFGLRYKNDNDRLRAIMQNIIKNKGAFKPEQRAR